ncbi:imidazole glycerol phosphate synthase subunit HisH [Paenibacillus sp. UMB4589-SE434]|uniref:imidazole glycerol phosphate synthase subunit HisH n=1 Tax=Paenibacillus sp. UMB4589-SE434 TaxID=3046314 RepID=UPI00254E82A3|nr:imidazole glycerol phosphate synthase subunit HisH [Paenibacillus sp. UMB4589-SE434]MDK8183606.1 imidazole glycerol phosphate synthase subunit HisH [Paenibacillus sp. UMB4589-SE434]
MIAIVDYGMGNLHSVSKAVERLGSTAVITADRDVLGAADAILLPGVGAFGDAMDALRMTGLDVVLKELVSSGKPLLGICLGMQLLFDRSEEHGDHEGLGLLKGTVVRFEEGIAKVPHMGWNELKWKQSQHALVNRLTAGHVYFVHSYHVLPSDPADLIAVCDYADREVTAIVARESIYGMQFHPEKSGELGLQLLQQFLRMVTHRLSNS